MANQSQRLNNTVQQAVLEGDGNSGGAAVTSVTIPEGMRAQKFNFRKEKIKDEAGNEIEVFKQAPVTIPLPIPTLEELFQIVNAPSTGEGNRAAEQKYLLELISDSYYLQARDQINEFREQNPKVVVTPDVIDYNLLSILALANMPASERGNKVSDEDMTAFLTDYLAVMPQATGKDASKIKAQAGIIEKGLRTVRTDKKVLEVMDDLLLKWINATSNADEHTQVYDMLKGRIKKWLTTEPKNVLDAIT